VEKDTNESLYLFLCSYIIVIIRSGGKDENEQLTAETANLNKSLLSIMK